MGAPSVGLRWSLKLPQNQSVALAGQRRVVRAGALLPLRLLLLGLAEASSVLHPDAEEAPDLRQTFRADLGRQYSVTYLVCRTRMFAGRGWHTAASCAA